MSGLRARVLKRKGRSGRDMRLKREVVCPRLLRRPQERGKKRTEYPGGARSAILASSPAGRSQVSVSSTMSMLFSWMKVEMSELFLEVLTDLALKRQMRSVFPAEEEPRGMWSSCLWGGRSGAPSEEAVRSSHSYSQFSYVYRLVRLRLAWSSSDDLGLVGHTTCSCIVQHPFWSRLCESCIRQCAMHCHRISSQLSRY